MDYIGLIANLTSIMCNLVMLWQVRKVLLKGAKTIEKDVLTDAPKKT